MFANGLFYLHPTRFRRSVEAHVPRKALRDLLNRARYSGAGPLSDEPLFVDARAVTHGYDVRRGGRRFRRMHSGCVIGGDWDLARMRLDGDVKLQSCRMRYLDGADWEDTPIFQRLMAEIASGHRPDGCATPEDVRVRYAELDRIYAETRARGRLLRRDELPDMFRREHGGIFMHVARDGSCLRAGGGGHRFAIASVLDLRAVPFQVGVVHPQAIRDGHLERLRRRVCAERPES
jgi:hypothetical protein